jgi:hypothetical protein
MLQQYINFGFKACFKTVYSKEKLHQQPFFQKESLTKEI